MSSLICDCWLFSKQFCEDNHDLLLHNKDGFYHPVCLSVKWDIFVSSSSWMLLLMPPVDLSRNWTQVTWEVLSHYPLSSGLLANETSLIRHSRRSCSTNCYEWMNEWNNVVDIFSSLTFVARLLVSLTSRTFMDVIIHFICFLRQFVRAS